jgi:hypothetical protein
MTYRRFRRLGVAAVLGAIALLALPPSPARADPAARVTPRTGLVDQQVVRVRASGFPPPPAENRIAVLQCVASATDVTGCGDFTSINVTTDATGSATTRYRVSRLIRTPAFGTIDCAASSGLCIIVVASLDASQIVTVPIDFDPTVPPLPPVDIDAELELTGKVNLRTGTVTLSGSVTCTIPTPVRITGSLGQQQGEAQAFGQVQDVINCVDSKRWSVTVRPNTTGARFRPGTAFADITLGVDRNGSRDRVELSTFDLTLVANGHR